ncbi:MAG: nucleotidyltransferase domain-containing protein [Bryobacteraceae bacterium]
MRLRDDAARSPRLWQTEVDHHGQRTRHLWKTPSADDPILAEIVRRLADVYRLKRIHLFGSTARGDAGPDGDYDLPIVVSAEASASRKNSDLGYLAVEDLPRSGDFLIWTRDRFESRLHLKASLPATVLREGRLLNAA